MGLRHCVQIDIPENAGEPVEILALQPAGRRPFEHTDRELVLPFTQIGGQVKLGGGKAVLAVSNIAAVAPQGKTALHPLERDQKRASLRKIRLHALRHPEVLHIRGGRIKLFRDLTRYDVLPSVPGILVIDIGRDIIPLHLDMGGHTDGRPCVAVKREGFKAFRRVCRPGGIEKTPRSVQGMA